MHNPLFLRGLRHSYFSGESVGNLSKLALVVDPIRSNRIVHRMGETTIPGVDNMLTLATVLDITEGRNDSVLATKGNHSGIALHRKGIEKVEH